MPSAPIAITMGEPAGIGGELAIAAWQTLRNEGPPFLLLDDPCRIRALATSLGAHVDIATIADADEARAAFHAAIPIMPLTRPVPLAPGSPTPSTASAVLESIETAVALARGGHVAAMVTSPIQKATLQDAGFPYPGHTEYLAALAGVPRTVMMLSGPDLRVVPVTVHVALANVPARLSIDAIVETTRILHRALEEDFALKAPRIAACGLNPHAGEEGRMGREEIETIVPALEILRKEGIDITGPHPADTMFHPRARARYHAALCMYHDQALVPLKTIAFDEGVNVTLGLPFVRTSPDHGTALDIAGRGLARPESLIAAIRLASDLAGRRNRPSSETTR